MARHLGPKPPPHPDDWRADTANWVWQFLAYGHAYNVARASDMPTINVAIEPARPRKPYERLNNHWGAKR